MNSFFRRLLDQLLRELGLSAPASTAHASRPASQAHQIAELHAWLQKGFARVRDLFARIKVMGTSASGAAPSTHEAPAAAPASAPAPAVETAPPPREPRPASPIVTPDDGEAPEDNGREPDTLEPDDRCAVHGPDSTSRPTHGQRTREQASRDAACGERPTIVNQAA